MSKFNHQFSHFPKTIPLLIAVFYSSRYQISTSTYMITHDAYMHSTQNEKRHFYSPHMMQ